MTSAAFPDSRLRRLARHLGVGAVAGATVMIFLFQPFKVEGTSMMPVLHDQERILVNKVVYGWNPIQRGDVIVFRFPRDPSKSFIKRVIGVPGDVVEVRGGEVRLNGRRLPEAYLFKEPYPNETYGPARVATGAYFVLGDHRSVSNDSRDWGLVPEDLIYGKAVLRYWPPAQFGMLH